MRHANVDGSPSKYSAGNDHFYAHPFIGFKLIGGSICCPKQVRNILFYLTEYAVRITHEPLPSIEYAVRNDRFYANSLIGFRIIGESVLSA